MIEERMTTLFVVMAYVILNWVGGYVHQRVGRHVEQQAADQALFWYAMFGNGVGADAKVSHVPTLG